MQIPLPRPRTGQLPGAFANSPLRPHRQLGTDIKGEGHLRSAQAQCAPFDRSWTRLSDH